MIPRVALRPPVRTWAVVERRGPGPVVLVLAGIVLLMLGGLVATIVVSVQHDVSSGYVEQPRGS